MAVNALSLVEALRPWRNAGVLFFLAEDDGACMVCMEEAEDMPEAAISGPAGLSDEAGVPPVTAVRPAPRRRPAPLWGSRGGVGRSSLIAEGEAEGARPADTARWPEHWQSLFACTRPAPLLWTYAELGADLLLPGRGADERSACLKDIIARLRLPRGTSCFWPFLLPEDDAPPGSGSLEHAPLDERPSEARPGLSPCFQEGVALLRPRIIIIFGDDAQAADELGLSLRSFYTQEVRGGVMFLLLPGFSYILAEQRRRDRVVTFLRGALSDIALLGG